MPEIWVPYGQVEVSFDIKQENLSLILETPQHQRISKEELESRAQTITANTILLLSGTGSVQQLIDVILRLNKSVTTLMYPKPIQAFARRKAQEFGIKAELLNTESQVDIGLVEGTPARTFRQVKETDKLAVLTSVHNDCLFGLSSGASDLISLEINTKSQAFKRSSSELPITAARDSAATSYAISLLQNLPSLDVIEVIEDGRGQISDFYYGDPESVHAQSLEYWKKSFTVGVDSKAERIIFGCGGNENDRTLADALSRSFFSLLSNLALKSERRSKICMLAECPDGLGSDALTRYIAGTYLPSSKLDDGEEYVEGLEVLLSFLRIAKDYELSIVSTLPKFFLSRLDFKVVNGAKDAPSSVLAQGSKAKVLVVPDASRSTFAFQ